MNAIGFFNVSLTMKDAEIRQLIIDGMKFCTIMNRGGLLAIDGFGNDPRDLWQIPEVVNFAKKLVAMGVCSILTTSTYLEKTWRENKDAAGRPFGAFELWLLAKEELGKKIEGEQLLTLFDNFCIDVQDSNERVVALSEGRIDDGNHKG